MDDDAPKVNFWQAVGMRATAATIATAQGADGPAGFVALSATHFCADPPTFTVAVGSDTSALRAIHESGHFAINVLSTAAVDVWDRFAQRQPPKGAARFEGLAFTGGVRGAPVFRDALAAYECDLSDWVDRGSTQLIFGKLVRLWEGEQTAPLVAYRNGMAGLGTLG